MPRVLILARNNLRRDTRVMNEARSLAEAGFDVVRVGVTTHAEDLPAEETPFDRIVRVRTTDKPLPSWNAPASGAGASPSARRGAMARTVWALRHLIGRIRDNLRVARSVASEQPAVVIACDLDMLLAGLRLKLVCGANLVYDAHELYYDRLTKGGTVFRFLFGTYERILIRRVDAMSTVNDALAQVFVDRYGIQRPMSVMNGPHRCEAVPHEPSTPLEVFFQGSYEAGRGLPQLVAAMAQVGDVARLTLQGFGTLESTMRDQVAELGLDDVVTLIEPCGPDEVVSCAAAYDVGVVGAESTCLSYRLSSPNKLFSYLGAGLALLCPDIPVARKIVEEWQCGVVVPSMSDDDLAAGIRSLAADADRVSAYMGGSRSACVDLGWERQVEPLVEVVRGFAEGRRS